MAATETPTAPHPAADDRPSPAVAGFIIRREQVAYLVVIVAAAVLRWFDLDRLPLAPDEAANAWAVWQFWQPAGEAAVPHSPVYFSVTALLSQLVGFSDGMMRLLPAVAGVAAVLWAARLRGIIGRTGTVVAALLLAVSPTLVSLSRTAGGDMFAVLGGMAAVDGWLRYRGTGRQTDLGWAAAGIAVALAASPLGYGLLMGLLVAVALERYAGPPLFANPLWPDADQWRRTGLTAVGVFAAASTLFLWYPAGLGAAGDVFARWLGAFGVSGDVLVWLDPVLGAARYESAALFLGLIASLWATWDGDPPAGFLAYWFVGALALLLIQPGWMGNVPLLAVPAYLLIGRITELLVQNTHWSWDINGRGDVSLVWPVLGLLVVLAGIVAMNLGRYARNPGGGSVHLSLIFICLIVGAAVWSLAVVWERPSALTGGWLVMLILSVVIGWNSAWRLGHTAGNDPRERWVQAATDDEIRYLQLVLVETATYTRGLPENIHLYSAVDTPVMRWYLRPFPNTMFADGLPSDASYEVVITAADEPDPTLNSAYSGSDFGLSRPDTDHALALGGALQWWIFYQSPYPIEDERVVVWLRSDLLPTAAP